MGIDGISATNRSSQILGGAGSGSKLGPDIKRPVEGVIERAEAARTYDAKGLMAADTSHGFHTIG